MSDIRDRHRVALRRHPRLLGSGPTFVPGLLVGAALILVPHSSCARSGSEADRPVLRVAQSSVSIGDPHIASDSSNRLSIIFNIYEALVKLDEEGHFQAGLAEAWEVAEDPRTWIFRLREGVRFHNGQVMAADDVVATLKRILDPSIGGAFGTQGVYLSYLATAEISAPDDSTVRIVTEHPMADLLDLLVAMPIGPDSELGDLPGRYVGSGPYKVAEQSDTRVVLTAHDDYWGRAPTYREIHWTAEVASESGRRPY